MVIRLSDQPPILSNALYDYAVANSQLASHPLLFELARQTHALPNGAMVSSVEQVSFIQLLIKLINAKQVVEVGSFTGYATLAMALALPDNANVLTCDKDSKALEIGKPYWQQAGISHKITSHIGPALSWLDDLVSAPQAGLIDLAYIDADKKNNAAYYEKLMPLMRTGGMIIVDNVLWKGKVIDATICDAQTNAIREFNQRVKQDSRVDNMMLLLGDGLMLVRKR